MSSEREQLKPAVELIASPILNFAFEQCGVPLVADAVVRNDGEVLLPASYLELQLVPDLGEPHRIPVPALPPGEHVQLGRIDVRMTPGKLRSILEAERCDLEWRLETDSKPFASGRHAVEVLPFNHWPGQRAPAGVLAAFSTPNHPIVTELVRSASDLLSKATGDGSITAYQRAGPKHVLAQVAAAFEAVQSLGLRYVESPPSFETSGQKVRLPDQLLRDGLGCCLDLTLLFAALLEQMGLHPLVILVKGHAFPAVWIVDDVFPEGFVEDAARIRNQVALGRLVPYESTAATDPSRPAFDTAIAATADRLTDDSLVAAYDFQSLRRDGFKPLPIRSADRVPDAAATGPTLSAGEIPAAIRRILDAAASAPEAPTAETPPQRVLTRLDRWKEKLLDLTLRNRLLNFKPDASTALALDVPAIASFEDALATGKMFEILASPAEETSAAARAARMRLTGDDKSTHENRRLSDLEKLRVRSLLEVDELWDQARHLERTARVDLEEGGANTLYVAVGILKWLPPGEASPRFAPLALYPITFKLDRDRRRVRFERLAEDPVGNVTLAEKLKRDFGIDASVLVQLEQDEAGLAIGSILQSVRTAIQAQEGWEVLEEAHIGLFTFTKFLMWKDLADNEQVVLSNPLVGHIASNGSYAPDEFTPATMAEAVDQIAPAELPCLVNADSTQMAAIASALAGRSFVLQGPPGTGKSQTITNLIAAAVGRGRSVLFVSEKMAALEVVHRRLKEVGVEDFCLELHSHKSNKKEVLASLGRAYEHATRLPPPPWVERSEELARTRLQLNEYAQALHRDWPIGHSVFSASSRLRDLKSVPDLRGDAFSPETFSEAQFRIRRDAVEELATRLSLVEPAERHPWKSVGAIPWSMGLQDQVRDALADTGSALERVQRYGATVASALRLEVPAATDRLIVLAELAHHVSTGPIDPRLADPNESSDLLTHAHGLVRESKEASELDLALRARWAPGLLEADLPVLVAKFQKWASAFFLFAFFALWSAKRAVRAYLRGAALPSNSNILGDLQTATRLLAARARAKSHRSSLEGRLSPETLAGAAEASAFEATLRRSEAARRLVQDLALSAPLEPPRTESERKTLSEAAEALRSACERLVELEEALGRLLALETSTRGWPSRRSPEHRQALGAQLRTWVASLGELRTWCQYRVQLVEAEEVGAREFLRGALAANVPPASLAPALERSVLTQFVRSVRDSTPALRDFQAQVHERRITRFRELDTEHLSLARDEVVHRLEKQLPARAGSAVEGSESALLARELRKRARHLPIRKLLQQIPNLLRRLKPCLLMSPLSVAQYLPAGGQRFDLLVFDEASQIGTHDAIGAIARASQVVIVGDSKQLPPTTFFQRGEDEDAALDDNDVVELESVLEEALAKQFPQQMLGWHYRSRHDSLIDFSNRHYYGGRLHIFPAARAQVDDLGVKWQPVPNGVYQTAISGKTPRVNPIEAQALVDELVLSLRRYRPDERTFGVVTFSSPQQALIEDLLDEARARYPEIEPHFQGLEHVFVKNLENVQGDERDEIFFSICYAKDATGKLRMHFGPLSQTGGERRLNVAITRARCQLRVFSTLSWDQIDLTRTRSIGATHLREFLRRAAELGTNARSARDRIPERGLERELAEELRASGYEVHANVGSGNYRIDLAVLNPGRPGEYLLGIECDGPNYRSGVTARDRDRLRGEVLASLGWRLHRVWAMEWAYDTAGQLKRLAAALEEAKSRPPEQAVPSVDASAAPEVRELAETEAKNPDDQPEQSDIFAAPYIVAKLAPATGDFYSPSNTPALQARLEEVVRIEAPIHQELLARRVIAAWGLNRVTDRVKARIAEVLDRSIRAGSIRRAGEFLWRSELDEWDSFRGADEAGELRNSTHLPPEEVANAAAAVLQAALSAPRPELVKATARILGIVRVGAEVAAAMSAGIAALEAAGRCRVEGDRVVWAKRCP